MKATAMVMPLIIVAAGIGASTLADLADDVPAQVYEPNSARRFGTPNPDAPQELEQFAFLVGEYACVDELTDLDGKTSRLSARWSGQYILNGHGIQDSYWNELFSTTNVRIYNEAQATWHVTYFRQPNFRSGVWTGGREAANLVLRRTFERDGQVVESRLTYRNITTSGFDWVSEYVAGPKRYANWRSRCQRMH